MTDNAKVMLSEFEAMLVNDSSWILTKHSVMEKGGLLLAQQVNPINTGFIEPLQLVLPELVSCKPRISKGERYRDLPYLMLDYPAIFSKTDVFALRTMFWWGNFISVTLHLSGFYKERFQDLIVQNLGAAGGFPFFLSTGYTEWEHHFGEENYTLLAGTEMDTLHKKIVQSSFVKIALQYNLHQWDLMGGLLGSAYVNLAKLLHHD